MPVPPPRLILLTGLLRKAPQSVPMASIGPFGGRRGQGQEAMISLKINGRDVALDVEPEMPLLWVLRDELDMTGTKFGCGIAACGACTVLVDGVATRTCVLPLSAVEGAAITTIEGVAENGVLSRVQEAWIDQQVPQCGYCQSGMILAATALLAKNPDPSDDDIDAAITNICRCGTYVRIRRAIHAAKTRVAENRP